jgi:hypothetical protein
MDPELSRIPRAIGDLLVEDLEGSMPTPEGTSRALSPMASASPELGA